MWIIIVSSLRQYSSEWSDKSGGLSTISWPPTTKSGESADPPLTPQDRRLWVGQLWRAPTASVGGDYSMSGFMSMLLLLISHEQKTQTLEIFDVVKTVLAVAVWTLSILLSWYSVLINVNLYYERPAVQETTQGVRARVGVIPPKMSYNPLHIQRAIIDR